MNALVAFRARGMGSQRPTLKWWEMGRQENQRLHGQLTAHGLKANSVAAAGDTAVSRVVDQELSRDAFLQLLVLEMQHQNPLEPVENAEMLAQLAQFSALEQMNNLNEGLETLSGNIDQLNFISATNLLGRRISGIDMSGQPREGTVERVHLDGSIVYLTVDGELMSMAGVMGIETDHDGSDSA